MILEVQTGMLWRACDDSERLDTERHKFGADLTETSHCASAEGTVHPSEEAKEHRASIEAVAERHVSIPVCRGQYELRSSVTRLYRGLLVTHRYLLAHNGSALSGRRSRSALAAG